MRRRDFVAFVAGSAFFRPLVGAVAAAENADDWGAGLGHSRPHARSRDIRIEIRSAEGDSARLAELAGELIRDRVDVIATWMTPAVLAAKRYQ